MKFTAHGVIPDSIPRAALVTGGEPRLDIARALADAGFAVALQCHAGIPADLPPKIVPLPADLSDEAQTAALIGRATAAVGPIGVLVNGAVTIARDTWDDATRATWDLHIEANLRAPFVLIQHFAKALPLPHEGVVINLLDQRISPRLLSYTLSKAALWSLTQTMALALAPRIRVNGITPATVTRDRPENIAGPEAIGRAAVAILAFASMTGQMIVPGGVPDAA